MKINNRALLSSLLSITLALCHSVVFANCPSPDTVIYHCYESDGHKMCSWNPQKGWYQGSGDASASLHDGDQLSQDSFAKAIWFPYIDSLHGATTCYYRGPEGERVTLFQKTGYGDVPPPQGDSWTASSIDGFPNALECTISHSACVFAFG